MGPERAIFFYSHSHCLSTTGAPVKRIAMVMFAWKSNY